MISSVVLAVVLCVVAGYEEEPKYLRVITVTKKFVDPKGSYQEDSYPVFVPQSYPIYVEKRKPYSGEQSQYGVPYDKPQPTYADKKTYPGTITPINDDEERYGNGEVVRSPVIFAVSNKSVYKRMPYPLKVHLSDRGHSCHEESLPHPEEFYYSAKTGERKEYKPEDLSSDAGTQKGVHLGGKVIGVVKPNDQDSVLYEKGGQVHHKEVFQTPLIITEEKPGHRYVKHLVGVGELPERKRFHVIILEEEDENEETPDSLPEEPGKQNQEPPHEESFHFNKKPKEEGATSEEKKPEQNVEENKDIQPKDEKVNGKGPQSDDGRITFPSSDQDSVQGYSGANSEEHTKAENDSEVKEAEVSELGGEIDIKMKS